jgi:hypothetical protein
MSPFDYVKAINETKVDLLAGDPDAVKDYNKVKFIVNRALGYFPDTVMQANTMNQHHDCPADWQFSFFLNTISKKRRFSKWAKADAESSSLELVKEYYGYSSEKAKEALSVLSDEHLIMIKEKLYKGGKS